MRLLIAEDEGTSRAMLERLVRKLGHDPLLAEDGEQAWQILEHERAPRLALLDWMMPKVDGLELCRRVRRQADRPYTYLVVISGRGRPAEIAEALEQGADDYITKPLDPLQLRSRLLVGARMIEYDTRLSVQNDVLRRYATEMEELAETRAKQLAHSDRMATLGRMSAGIAHEINNPTTFISGNVQVLQRYWNDLQPLVEQEQRARPQPKLAFILEEFQQTLLAIENGVERISSIVDGLKVYSRRDAAPRTVAVPFAGWVARCDKLCAHALKGRLELEVDLPEDLPAVEADPQQLDQVLINLLINAADALEGRSQPKARISARRSPRGLCLDIVDNGPGIPPEKLDQIWEPFFTTKPPGKGTGLGLAISRSIVEAFGGTLEASNRSEGGACFSIDLPLSPQQKARA